MDDWLLSALARLAEEDIRGSPSAEGIADILWMARLLPPAPPGDAVTGQPVARPN